MNHMEFAAAESAALNPTPYEKWLERLEKLMRLTQGADFNLDGDRDSDGYSLDCCIDLYKKGKRPLDASMTLLWRINGLHKTH